MPTPRSAPSRRSALARAWLFPLVLAALLAVPAPAAALQVADYCADEEERAFLDLINAYRAQNGLGPLQLSQTLGAAAEEHSLEMAANNYFDHTMLGGVTVAENLQAHGYLDATYGENIAAGSETAAGAFAMWQGSANHNANMLRGAYNAVGVGRAYDPNSGYGWYWTTIFGGSADGPATLCGQAPPPPPADVAPAPVPAPDPAPEQIASEQPAAGATGAATSDLNLRSGPGATYPALGTVSRGGRLIVAGPAEGGYYPVTVDGRYGWVAADFVALDAGSPPAETTAAGQPPDALAAPQTTAAPGAEQSTTAAAPAAPAPAAASGAATATDLLNLRSGPSYGDEVLRVMPPGAPLTITGAESGGFLPVLYDGTPGWADAAYLELAQVPTDPVPAPAAPAPPPSDTALAAAPQPAAAPTGGATATADLNLRTGPGPDGSIVLLIPSGAAVTLTGEASGGFLGVSYGGATGWADATYLAL